MQQQRLLMKQPKKISRFKTENKDLKVIIKLLNKTVKAHKNSAKIYKAELKEVKKLYNKVFNNWLSSMDMIAGLNRDKQNIWNQRNQAVRDYIAIHQLAAYANVPSLKHYDLPENMNLDPSKNYDFTVDSKVMESGRVKNRIVVKEKNSNKETD